MIARVSVLAVDRFEKEVARAKDYSPLFTYGIGCLEDFRGFLWDKSISLEGCRQKMGGARWRLSVTLESLESREGVLKADIHRLSERLESLPNDEDSAAEAERILKWIDEAQEELSHVQSRIEHAKSVDCRISCHIESLKMAQSVIERNREKCRRLIEELEQVRYSNSRCGEAADEKLKRIRRIVTSYRNTRLYVSL